MTAVKYRAAADEPLTEAYQRMQENQVRHLPVTDGDQLVGILSARECDLLQLVPADVQSGLKVDAAMSKNVYTVEADTPVDVVAREMSRQKYGSALIVEKNETVGVFTTTDALRALSDALTDSLPESTPQID